MNDIEICKDFGQEPRCKKVADPSYTMRFDDIGEAPIHWCSFCGPTALKLMEIILSACKNNPDKMKELEERIDKCEEENRAKLN